MVNLKFDYCNSLFLFSVGPNTELMVSPVKHTAIKGEVNILRYLSRLGPPKYNYELNNEPMLSAKIDAILDTCYNIAHCRTAKEKQSLIRALNSHLGKNQYLAGGIDISIADIAAWSVLKQIDAQNLTNNMTSWLQRCSQQVGGNCMTFMMEICLFTCMIDIHFDFFFLF